MKTIRDAMKKIETLIGGLYSLAVNCEICGNDFLLNDTFRKPSRLLTAALRESGCAVEKDRICMADGCADGLKELALISRENTVLITDSPIENKEYLYFSHCAFEPKSDWLVQVFDRVLDADGQLIWLCSELAKRGYRRVDCKDGKRISLDYIKTFGKKEMPLKLSWADKYHYGIELTFEDLRLEPYFIWVRMPDFANVLKRCDRYDENVGAFIRAHTKTCNACRYCVQTDKTGTRPLAAITTGGKKKCPYFPSFTMNGRSLSAESARSILEVLDEVYE